MIRRQPSPLAAPLRWLTVLLWAGFIWWLLTLPGEKTPDISSIPLGDKLGHLAVYFVWGFLICWAAHTSFSALSRTSVALISIIAAALYGAVAELYQAGIGRDADSLDVLADITGAAVAQYFYFSPKLKALLDRAITSRASPVRSLARRASSSPESKGHDGRIEPPAEDSGKK